MIEYVGEIGEQDKAAFLGGASALLFPIDWPEPFGLVMIEAMACGTPVIAYRRGSVPEVIDDGWTGFIVDDLEGAVAAVAKLDRLDHGTIRARFEQRFTAERMANDYVAAYSSLMTVPELSPMTPSLDYAFGTAPSRDGVWNRSRQRRLKSAWMPPIGPLPRRRQPGTGRAVLYPGDLVAAGAAAADVQARRHLRRVRPLRRHHSRGGQPRRPLPPGHPLPLRPGAVDQ